MQDIIDSEDRPAELGADNVYIVPFVLCLLCRVIDQGRREGNNTWLNVSLFTDDAHGISLESLHSPLLVETRGTIDISPAKEPLTRYGASYREKRHFWKTC